MRPHTAGRWPSRLLWIGVPVILLGWAVVGQASSTADLDAAIRRLGATSFSERHAAGEVLLRAGAAALPYLREAALSGSPEVRYRSFQLIEEIQSQLLETQASRILGGEDLSSELAAWNRYMSAVDDTPAARTLFVEMLKASPNLVTSIGTAGLQEEYDLSANESLNSRVTRNAAAVEELAALLFAAVQPECTPGALDTGLLSQHLNLPRFQAALQDQTTGPPLKDLVTAWVIRADAGPPQYRLNVAEKISLPAGLSPARMLVRKHDNSHGAQMALQFIARFGNLEDVHDIEQLLEDAQELASRRRNGEFSTEVRDLALATLWTLVGENPAKHSMPNAAKANGQLNYGAIGFASDASRMKAIAEWRHWRKRHVRAYLPPDGNAIEGWTM